MVEVAVCWKPGEKPCRRRHARSQSRDFCFGTAVCGRRYFSVALCLVGLIACGKSTPVLPSYARCRLHFGQPFLTHLLRCAAAAGPRVSMLQPTKGPASGGTRVTVVGTGFKSGTTRCQFGPSRPISAMYISQTQVVCFSPAAGGSSISSLPVEVTTDNSGSAETFSADGILFSYQSKFSSN